MEQEKKITFVDTLQKQAFFAHETAVIDYYPADIGPETKIWHFSHILPNSKIGKQCIIGQNVVIGPNALIGDGCKIQNNVSVYEGVELEDKVFCGPSMVFTNVYNPRCEIPRKNQYRKTMVKKGATLGANCTIFKQCYDDQRDIKKVLDMITTKPGKIKLVGQTLIVVLDWIENKKGSSRIIGKSLWSTDVRSTAQIDNYKKIYKKVGLKLDSVIH